MENGNFAISQQYFMVLHFGNLFTFFGKINNVEPG